MVILVSACLIGVNCKYTGGNNFNDEIMSLKEVSLIPVCPEQLGGLTTPRPSSEINGCDGLDVIQGKGKVISIDGEDKTKFFIKGAQETLSIAKTMKSSYAILKAKSPSCGVDYIYDGSFTRTLRDGDGVTTALLKHHGINVYSELNYNIMNT